MTRGYESSDRQADDLKPPPQCRPRERTVTAADLRHFIAHEDQAGNLERAAALRCLLNWVNGSSYIVKGVGHE